MCTLYIQNVWMCRKIEYPEQRKFKGKLCTRYMYGMSGLAKNWMSKIAYILLENVHYVYEMSGVAEKSNIQNSVNWTGNCVHYMYGMSGFAENLNIHNYLNSTVSLVHKCSECLDLQKIWMSRTAKIHREIVYIIYVRNV